LLQALIRFRLAEVLPHIQRDEDAQKLFQRLCDDSSLTDTLRLAASSEQQLLRHGIKRAHPGSGIASELDLWTWCREL
jgi:hypothetical protein